MSKILTEQCNFIAIGAWNPAIIQPTWLKQEFPTLITSKKIGIQAAFGTTAQLNFEIEKKIILSSNNNRLIIIPKRLDDETFDFIKELSIGIRKKLFHTPIEAAGYNFVFELGEKECFSIDDLENGDNLNDFYNSLNQDLKNLTTRNIQHVFPFEDHTLNIHYQYVGQNKIIQYNYNYQAVSPMEKAAESLKDNYKKSLELNKKLIKGV